MKKIKKLLAMIMAMTMVLGMAMTVSAAAPTTGDIIVSGLVKESTTVDVYQVLKADTNVNKWIVNQWAEDYVALDQESNEYEFDWDQLKQHVPAGDPDRLIHWSQNTSTGTTTFEELPIGAYLVIATSTADGSTTVYNVMGTYNTEYDESTEDSHVPTHLMQGRDVTVYAKSSKIDVDKTADDNFVAKGQTVTFTVTTTFPYFTEEELAAQPSPTYKVVDTPTGLRITGVTSVIIGDPETEAPLDSSDYSAGYDDTELKYIIDLSSQIGTGEDANQNVGKTVTITYTAEVTADDGYSNTVNVLKNETETGTNTETGYTGDITITKYGEEQATLAGAVFNVYMSNTEVGAEDTEHATKLYFTGANGVYSLVAEGTPGATDEIVTNANGTVQIKGLAEGFYFFDEIVAPDGYSINEEGVTVEISALTSDGKPVSDHVHVTDSVTDTKLASLPETGGIGTTIFTIGGCAIMIAAAVLYFVNRRKSEEN